MTLKGAFRMGLLILGILLVDIVSKGITHFYFKPLEQASYFFPFGGIAIFQAGGIKFCIHHVTNKGVAWGLGSGFQDLILIVRGAILTGIVIYMLRSKHSPAHRYPFALIIAGGMGNMIDYFIYGHVVDMFHFIFWGYSYPVFNIADAAIFFGIATLLWKGWNNSCYPDVAIEKQ